MDSVTWRSQCGVGPSGNCRAVIDWVGQGGAMTSQQSVGYDGMWAQPGEDPRTTADPVGELATVREYLTNYRHTLAMKCDGLTPEQLATRSVPPSTMSLLGLVRHLGGVEHHWFRRVLQARPDLPRLYRSAEDRDLAFDGAVADPALAADAFTTWRAEVEAADQWLDGLTDLGALATMPNGDQVSVRDVLVHLVEEYARHCGHADLLRECIDGRTGQ
jgi:uncharacterized damage-inducible protein DinB